MKKRIFALLLLLSLALSLFGCIPSQDIPPESKAIDESHFSVLSITEAVIDGEENARVSILTDISIVSYWITVTLLDKDGNTLTEYVDHTEEKVAANSSFSVYIPLGEVTFDKILSTELDGTATTLDVNGNYLLESHPRVTFMYGDVQWAKQSAPEGEPISCPDTPTPDGKIFEGWYADEEYKTPFDFAKGIYADTVAYAKLTDDIGDTVNRITKELMTSCVTVRATYTEDRHFAPATAVSTSSGVIIRKGLVSYVLTNCHSVTLLEGYKKIEIEVEDCFGNVYPASVATSGDTAICDPSYDLAILAVGGMSDKLGAIELAAENPSIGERVYSIGSPSGQSNAITVGEITDFLNVKLEAEEYLTNVEFGVFLHTAEVRQGSSGGALVNSNLQLVGINYAGKGGDAFSNGYAIPINKIHEFIEKYM